MNALEEVSLNAAPYASVWIPIAWSQAITVLLIAMAFLGLCAWIVHTPKKGALKMGRDTIKVSDIIRDSFDEAVRKGTWTQKQADYWMARIGGRADIPDLRFRARWGKKLSLKRITRTKEQIKYRLNRWMHVRDNADGSSTETRKFYDKGAHTSIPGPLPGDDLRILNPKQEESGARRQKFATAMKAA